MFIGLQIAHKDHSNSHSILSHLSDIHRNVNIVLQLQLIALNRDDLNHRHVLNQFLRVLSLETTLFQVPGSPFNGQSSNVTAIFRSLFNLTRVLVLSHNGVQSGLVEGPLFLSTGSLHQSSHVGLRDVQTGNPHNHRFFLDPLLVLFESLAEMVHPGTQFLLGLRGQSRPRSR